MTTTANRKSSTHARESGRRIEITCEVNGETVTFSCDPVSRASEALRDHLKLTGTKVGCDAGDCGACTIRMNDQCLCACMLPAARLNGAVVQTVEGLARDPVGARLQRAFRHHGAAQCGICTPGMLMAARSLLAHETSPSTTAIEDALGGVLCRCTGYRKIIAAVHAAARPVESAITESGPAVGAPIERIDGQRKVDGGDTFAADAAPAGALALRTIRSPYHRARFEFGDIEQFVAQHDGIELVLTATDIPGENSFGVIPQFQDQPVFAVDEARFRGEAVAAIVGTTAAISALDLNTFPVTYTECDPVLTIDAAQYADAPLVQPQCADNVLTGGRVRRGDLDAGFEHATVVAEGEFETAFVEHAYIEPEAGYAERLGNRIEVFGCTQAPHMDRDSLARILALPVDAIRIRPSAVGGGFGSKLDLSFQPLIALAAWRLNRPVRIIYDRHESMKSTTKRHASRLSVRIGADDRGRLTAMQFLGEFNTGAYASWGPTVANRVPVHASGPYVVPAYDAQSKALLTHCAPAGAFRGFGVPQSAIATEALLDELAIRLNMDRLEFRQRNALTNGAITVTGQTFQAGVGMRACLDALADDWQSAQAEVARFNHDRADHKRRGVGVASCWYGCGNTSLPNPSTIKVGIRRDARVVLFQGAVDIGQGSNTVIAQICADALGLPLGEFELVDADTDRTPDAGKTSASRQTFVSGRAALAAGANLRNVVLNDASAGANSQLSLRDGKLYIRDGDHEQVIALTDRPADDEGLIYVAEGTFDPPTTPLDENGQGEPYATYGFGAQIAVVECDTALGTVKPIAITAAHDVGRAINPQLAEGQIEGGIAQGIGMALMEAFVPGRADNLHDYLIPTIGDVPPVKIHLIEEADPIGPYGAKGLGEHVLIPTAPAILNAIADATGARITQTPATPDRVLKAIREQS